MKSPIYRYLTFSFIASLLLAACASNQSVDMAALRGADITNFRAPESGVLSSGQPTRDQLQVMAAAGVKHVVNLRTPQEEVDFDEKSAVEALGMVYHSIPVAGAGGINRDNANSLQQVLQASAGQPVLVHCATGNRVGGLMAVNAYSRNGDLDAAIAEGARWGMTSDRLQEAVRENLANQ